MGMKTQQSPPRAIVYTVQQYLWQIWHDVLTTSDQAKASALKVKLGEKARVIMTSGGMNDRPG
jgi:hypothetical protein